MSENNRDPLEEATQRFTEGQNQFARMWTDFAGKMTNAGVAFSPESTPPDAARQMRNTFLQALSAYCEDYMRSPEFLNSWKQAMDGAIQFRRQMNESLGKMQHEFGGTSRQDVDNTMMALTHLERRLVDAIERSTDRLEEIVQRVEALEKNTDQPSPAESERSEVSTEPKPKSKKQTNHKKKQ